MTETTTAGPSLKSEYTPSAATLSLLAANLLALFVWVFWTFFERQARFAIEFQADWGHTIVIPFIAGWFVWLNRERILSEPLRPSLMGAVLVIVGILWFAVSAIGPVLLRHHNIMGMGVGITLFGIVLALCGWKAMKWLWVPVVYLIVFSQTISDRFLEILTFELQGIATVGAEVGLSLFGYDVARQGHTLDIYHDGKVMPLNIAEACSGMRMLVAFLALGVAMAYRGLDTVWQRIVLVLMAVPTALFVNVLRVMTLAVLSTLDTNFAAGDFHSMVGLLWLIPAFFIYLGIMWALRLLVIEIEEEPEEHVGEQPVRFSGRIISVFIACIGLLVIGKVGLVLGAEMLHVHMQREPVDLRRSLSLIPSAVGSWRSVSEQKFDAAILEQLGTSSCIARTYIDDDAPSRPPLQLHLAYYTDQIDAVPHVPDRCGIAAGLVGRTPEPTNRLLQDFGSSWQPDSANMLDGVPYPIASVRDTVTETDIEVRMPIGDAAVRHMEFLHPQHPDERIHAGYFFVVNGRWRPSPTGVKIVAFTGGEAKAYYCKVQIMSAGDARYDEQAFLAHTGDFLQLMLPEIMRSLPDWKEENASEVTGVEAN